MRTADNVELLISCRPLLTMLRPKLAAQHTVFKRADPHGPRVLTPLGRRVWGTCPGGFGIVAGLFNRAAPHTDFYGGGGLDVT